jgi:hypothetical protein
MRKRIQLTPHLTVVDSHDETVLVARPDRATPARPEEPATEVCRTEGVPPIGEEFATAVLLRFVADTGKKPRRVIFAPNGHLIFELADGTRHLARIRHAAPAEGSVVS